jgi:hypothetical protein
MGVAFFRAELGYSASNYAGSLMTSTTEQVSGWVGLLVTAQDRGRGIAAPPPPRRPQPDGEQTLVCWTPMVLPTRRAYPKTTR